MDGLYWNRMVLRCCSGICPLPGLGPGLKDGNEGCGREVLNVLHIACGGW